MGQARRFSHRGSLLCILVGVVLLPVALSIAPPTAVASEGGENVGENVTVYRASNVSFESAEGIEVAIANGTVEPADKVAVGDTLVVAIPSERLADAMKATNNSTASTNGSATSANGSATAPNGSATARFFAALDGDAEFRIVQTNPTPERSRIVARMGPGNVTAFRDGTTVYAVVETGDLSFEYRGVNRLREIFGGERFAVQFGYDLPHDWSRGTVPESPIIEFHPRSELTTDQPETTVTPTRTSSETPTSERTISTPTRATAETSMSSSTTRERATTIGTAEEQTGVPGVPGFTVPTALVALLALAVLGTRRR